MDARESVADELLRDVRQPVAVALCALFRRERRATSNTVECVARPIGDAPVELTGGVAVERSARRIRCVPRDARQLQRFVVVERRMPTAMMDDDRMLGRYLVEVACV